MGFSEASDLQATMPGHTEAAGSEGSSSLCVASVRHLEHRLVRAIGIRKGHILEFHSPLQSGGGQCPRWRHIWLSVQVAKNLLSCPHVAQHIPVHVHQGLENRSGGGS